MEQSAAIRKARLSIWRWYRDAFAAFEEKGLLRGPWVPSHCEHNGHMFYILLNDAASRTRVLQALNAGGINSVFHYVPLHTSRAGRRFARAAGELPHTTGIAERLIRLPMWIGMTEGDVEHAAAIVGRTTG